MAPLFKDVASNYPTCTFIKGESAATLRNMCTAGRNLSFEDKVYLLQCCPSIFKCATQDKWNTVPPAFQPLLQYLCDRAEVLINFTAEVGPPLVITTYI